MHRRIGIFTWFVLGLFLVSFAAGQDKASPLTLEKVEEALKEGALPQGRLATIIRDQGISFEVTEEVKARLKRAGADAVVMQAVERAGVEYVRRELEEEKRRVEADRRKVEEEKRRIEEAKQREEGRRKAEEAARRKVEEEKKRSKDGAEVVLIPAGEFWMGSEDGDADEKPRRRVYLDAFQIDKYEVTNALYRKFMEATGRAVPGYWNNSNFNGANQPVVGVTWHDADAYCKWAGKRLPTEAEWEKAARGPDGRKYPWGDQWDSSRANSTESKINKTAPVGSYPGGVSPYGVHDMAGNVWEWVADWYDANYYQRSPDRNPKGPDSGSYRVLRGGSWGLTPRALRASNRSRYGPAFRDSDFGFRCAQ